MRLSSPRTLVRTHFTLMRNCQHPLSSSRELLHLSLSCKRRQPRRPLADIEFHSRVRAFHPRLVVKRPSLNESHPSKRFTICDLADNTTAILTERIRQGHSAVLSRRICLRLPCRDLEIGLRDDNIGGERAARHMSTSYTMAYSLKELATLSNALYLAPTFSAASPVYSYLRLPQRQPPVGMVKYLRNGEGFGILVHLCGLPGSSARTCPFILSQQSYDHRVVHELDPVHPGDFGQCVSPASNPTQGMSEISSHRRALLSS